MIRCVSADEASSSLPEDPLLAAMAASLGGAGRFVMVVDDQWRLAYVSEDQRLAIGAMVTRADFAIAPAHNDNRAGGVGRAHSRQYRVGRAG